MKARSEEIIQLLEAANKRHSVSVETCMTLSSKLPSLSVLELYSSS